MTETYSLITDIRLSPAKLFSVEFLPFFLKKLSSEQVEFKQHSCSISNIVPLKYKYNPKKKKKRKIKEKNSILGLKVGLTVEEWVAFSKDPTVIYKGHRAQLALKKAFSFAIETQEDEIVAVLWWCQQLFLFGWFGLAKLRGVVQRWKMDSKGYWWSCGEERRWVCYLPECRTRWAAVVSL